MYSVVKATLPDGEIYEIPVSVILEHKINAEKSEYASEEEARTEITELFDSEWEIEDYLAFDLTWDDVKNVAQYVGRVECDYNEVWEDITFEVI